MLVAVGLACSGPPPSTAPPPDGGVFVPSGPLLATGAHHTCAIVAGGTVRCWGDNRAGQLGRPGAGDPLGSYSVDLGTGRRAAGIFAGFEHTCALLEGGALKCWGANEFGQLGLGDTTQRGDGTGAMGDALPAIDLGAGRRAVAVAPGNSATCALLDDGMVKCWGDPYQGALGYGDLEPRGDTPATMGDALPIVDLGSRPNGVPFKATSIAAIDYHSFCAILADTGSDNSGLKCWGSNDYCELGIGTRDGGRGAEPGMMGNNLEWVDIGMTAAGSKRKATAFAGGYQFACALGDDGAVKCWGVNLSGQLGIGSTASPISCAREETGDTGFVALPGPAVAIGARGPSDGGGAHACALLASGDVTCWGENASGQLGTGDTTAWLAPSPPLAFEAGFTPATLVLGNQHTCAIAKDKRVKCWGSNREGQLGPTVASDLYAPGADTRLRGHPVEAIAAGHDHTCALLAGGVLRCWGRNSDGQLGLGDTTNRGDAPGEMGDALPAVDIGGAAVTAVAAGAAHTCAVLAGGEVKCWGDGTFGQLGHGTLASRPAPASPIALPSAATGVAAGADFSCALLSDGRVACWGAGERGSLGLGDSSGRVEPDGTVELAARATALAAGDHHACALLSDGRVACWGANDRGQLGLGDTQDRPRASPVALGSARAIAVGARLDSTCVLRDDGQVSCWGANDRGQLGLGDTEARLAPASAVDLGSARRASGLSVGGGFACALLDTAQVKCWGDNRTNQLGAPLRGPAYGDGPNETGDFLPVASQGGGRTLRAIAAGRAHVCAILDTGDARCWGDNSVGQLGAGDTNVHSPFVDPTAVVDLGREP